MVNARRSIRLKGYDYTSDGAYFVMIGAHERRCVFGHIADDTMILNEWGRIVAQEWYATAERRPYVELDAFVVMPNHVHGIIIRHEGRGLARQTPTHPPQFAKPIAASLGTIVGAFKSAARRRINRLSNAPDYPVWQRNYYEHIIRNEDEQNDTRGYIVYNPARWACDELFS